MAGRRFNALSSWAIAFGLPRNKQAIMDVEETQVSVKFVTKLPDQLKVPEEVLVSIVKHRNNLCPGPRKNSIFVAECACKAH